MASRRFWVAITAAALAASGYVCYRDITRVNRIRSAIERLQMAGVYVAINVTTPRWYSPGEVIDGGRRIVFAVDVNCKDKSHYDKRWLLRDIACFRELKALSFRNCSIATSDLTGYASESVTGVDIGHATRGEGVLLYLAKSLPALRVVVVDTAALTETEIASLAAMKSLRHVYSTAPHPISAAMKRKLPGVKCEPLTRSVPWELLK